MVNLRWKQSHGMMTTVNDGRIAVTDSSLEVFLECRGRTKSEQVVGACELETIMRREK